MRRKKTATKKRSTGSSGSFMRKVQRSSRVRNVRNKIKRKKAELKKLSREYKTALKTTAKKLSSKKR